MEDLRQYYAILGLKPGASRAQIEQAYAAAEDGLHAQRLADDPQVRGKTQARLKVINEAYLAIVDAAQGAHAVPTDDRAPSGPLRDDGARHLSHAADTTESSDASFPPADAAAASARSAEKAGAWSVPQPPQPATSAQIPAVPFGLLRKEVVLFLAILAALFLLFLVIHFRPIARNPPPVAIDNTKTPAVSAGLGSTPASHPEHRLTADVATITRDAEGGNVKAQTFLGYLYVQGTGVPRNFAEAARWFGSAAAQGDAEAQNWLGYLYETGQGVSRDDGEAAKWYRRSAEQENADAEKNLGLLYARGSGVAANRQEAARWLRRGAAHGSREAQEALKRLRLE